LSRKILEVKDLRTRFHTEQGVVHAVNGISYSIEEGESVGIVGESGCGKSVSVLSIMRLLPEPPAKVQGSVLFGGQDLLGLPAADVRKIRGSQIAMIFQDPMTSLNPVLTIGLQLMEPLQIHLGMSEDEARERAAELLQLVGIPQAEDRLDDYPHQFSGGMRQRAMIAMALTCNPTLLIADEPTTALDVTIQAQIADLVNRLREQFGMSLIWITHDLGVVAGLADRVIVMYAGYIVEEAKVEELYGNPLHPYAYLLLQSLPRMDEEPGAALESIQGLPPDLIDLPPACPFAERCPFVKDLCLQYNPPLFEIEPGHKSACWVDMETGELREEMVAEYMAQVGKAA
jgi:oligopeptide transport system ATP-binding protein